MPGTARGVAVSGGGVKAAGKRGSGAVATRAAEGIASSDDAIGGGGSFSYTV